MLIPFSAVYNKIIIPDYFRKVNIIVDNYSIILNKFITVSKPCWRCVIYLNTKFELMNAGLS